MTAENRSEERVCQYPIILYDDFLVVTFVTFFWCIVIWLSSLDWRSYCLPFAPVYTVFMPVYAFGIHIYSATFLLLKRTKLSINSARDRTWRVRVRWRELNEEKNTLIKRSLELKKGPSILLQTHRKLLMT